MHYIKVMHQVHDINVPIVRLCATQLKTEIEGEAEAETEIGGVGTVMPVWPIQAPTCLFTHPDPETRDRETLT